MEDDSILVTPYPQVKDDTEIIAPCAPDKSLTHRAIMLASMAAGDSQILNPLDGDDCIATRRVFQNLGVVFEETKSLDGQNIWNVRSPGMDHWRSPSCEQDLGNSGTSARLLTGLFSGIPGLRVTLSGDESLSARPMGRVVLPLRNMGANISGPSDGETLKLTITGSSLNPVTHSLHTSSAQIKSAILFAAISAPGETRLDIQTGARNHTENMLSALGANIQVIKKFGREAISIVGPWRPKPFKCAIPADPSSVAFFAALAALHPGVRMSVPGVLDNPTRNGFYNVLRRMGVHSSWEQEHNGMAYLGESASRLSVSRSLGIQLQAVHIGADEVATMIDEIPVLAVLCSYAQGTSVIEGLAELRVKESDRLASIESLLKCADVEVRVENNSLIIKGRKAPSAFSFSSNDHRMVMSAMVLATAAGAPSEIRGLNWIRTSFPLFLEAFQNIKTCID